MPKQRLLFCLGALSFLLGQQADAHIGVGWSMSAAGSGWYLERVSEAGDRVQLTCSPGESEHWTYGMIVLPLRHFSNRSPRAATLTIDQSENHWRYPLTRIDVGYWWQASGRDAFDVLLRRLSETTLDDRVTAPELGISFAPRNSDQETTISEYRRLCHVPQAGGPTNGS